MQNTEQSSTMLETRRWFGRPHSDNLWSLQPRGSRSPAVRVLASMSGRTLSTHNRSGAPGKSGGPPQPGNPIRPGADADRQGMGYRGASPRRPFVGGLLSRVLALTSGTRLHGAGSLAMRFGIDKVPFDALA
jgi:hypothetical protein